MRLVKMNVFYVDQSQIQFVHKQINAFCYPFLSIGSGQWMRKLNVISPNVYDTLGLWQTMYIHLVLSFSHYRTDKKKKNNWNFYYIYSRVCMEIFPLYFIQLKNKNEILSRCIFNFFFFLPSVINLLSLISSRTLYKIDEYWNT